MMALDSSSESFSPLNQLVTPRGIRGSFDPRGHHMKQEGHDGPVSLHWLIPGNLFKT